VVVVGDGFEVFQASMLPGWPAVKNREERLKVAECETFALTNRICELSVLVLWVRVAQRLALGPVTDTL
jgi:hypothetical protein